MFFYNAFKVMDLRFQSRGRDEVREGSTWTDNDMELSERSWLLEDYEERRKSVPEAERIGKSLSYFRPFSYLSQS
nr:unnamed protein product [Callosobruchus chinensis]